MCRFTARFGQTPINKILRPSCQDGRKSLSFEGGTKHVGNRHEGSGVYPGGQGGEQGLALRFSRQKSGAVLLSRIKKSQKFSSKNLRI